MQTSILTSKGQVTVPADIRRRLGLAPGDRVAFILDGDHVELVRRENRIEAAFGICKPTRSVSDEDMERVIRRRAGA